MTTLGTTEEVKRETDEYGHETAEELGHEYVPPYAPPLKTAGTGPRLLRLETLSVSALECGAEGWLVLLESARALVRLQVDVLPLMHEDAFALIVPSLTLVLPLPNGGTDNEGVERETPARNPSRDSKGKGRATDDVDQQGEEEEEEYKEVPIEQRGIRIP
ncbi:hypothetical protein GSI_08760 [Ganoderma sinense ZZ0214-1]|uniref:Uncharacterized protein n=1 Tax=Ganoderma sinense ZZ0214-1 TaxID=1077348 RepID=A0A2G8S4L7_9APHY|nr:hypothetical protein GSI_08760 [Ganoderma sinense ZZ0214-1]